MTFRNTTILTILTCVGLSGCADKDGDTGANETGETGETGTGSGGITLSGTATNLLTGAPAAEGLCVHVADPTAAVGGGELEILASSTIGADGAYSVAGVDNTIYIGLLVLVEDCEGSGTTVMPTATGVKREEYYDLADGATLSDFAIYSIDGDSQAGFQTGLEGAGYAADPDDRFTGDLGADGTLIGFVLDSAGDGVEGASVSTPDGYPAYYMAADGSFNTTGTATAARGMFLVPAAPIATYGVTADGYTFESELVGSQAGYAVLIRFIGTAG